MRIRIGIFRLQGIMFMIQWQEAGKKGFILHGNKKTPPLAMGEVGERINTDNVAHRGGTGVR